MTGLFPLPARESFLRAWLANPDAVSLAAVVGGRLTGYGVVRKCVTGYKIGPLFADDPAVADA